MIESKEHMDSGFDELCIIEEEESIQKPKDEIIEIPITNEKDSLIDKKRALKRWKKSFGYYSLNPEKFNFTFKDL